MNLKSLEKTKQKAEDESIAAAMSSSGWAQGSLFLPDNRIKLPFDFDPNNECLVIATQSCSVVSTRFERDPLVEGMAVRKLKKINERAPAATGKDQRELHLKLSREEEGYQGFGCDINRRVFFDRKLLLQLKRLSNFTLEEREIKKFANWIARYYTRIALPDDLVNNMKCQLIPKLEAILKQNVNGIPLHCDIDSIYINYQISPKRGNGTPLFTLQFICICRSQDTSDKMDIAQLTELNDFYSPNGINNIFISLFRCGIKNDTFLSDLDGYERLSEWDYFTHFGEINFYISTD